MRWPSRLGPTSRRCLKHAQKQIVSQWHGDWQTTKRFFMWTTTRSRKLLMNMISTTTVGKMIAVRLPQVQLRTKFAWCIYWNTSGFISANKLLNMLKNLDQLGDVRSVCPHYYFWCKICSPLNNCVLQQLFTLSACPKEGEKFFFCCNCTGPWCFYNQIWLFRYENRQHGTFVAAWQYCWSFQWIWKCAIVTPYLSIVLVWCRPLP